MIRHVAALAVAVCLCPSGLFAQTTRLTVTVPSADIHKFPTVGSPVIARATRGTVLDVTRTLGSWVTVSWPDGENGLAFMHVNTGSLGTGATPAANRTGSASGSARPSPQQPVTAVVRVESSTSSQAQRRPAAPANPVYVSPTTHAFGLGGRVAGEPTGLGASVRSWSDSYGFQLVASRSNVTSFVLTDHLETAQIEPSVLFSLGNHVGDYVWLRPYVGSGVHYVRRTLKTPILGDSGTRLQSGYGFQAFGGAELTLSSVPRLAFSMDLSRRWSRRPVAGFELGGWGLTASGHWYVK